MKSPFVVAVACFAMALPVTAGTRELSDVEMDNVVASGAAIIVDGVQTDYVPSGVAFTKVYSLQDSQIKIDILPNGSITATSNGSANLNIGQINQDSVVNISQTSGTSVAAPLYAMPLQMYAMPLQMYAIPFN